MLDDVDGYRQGRPEITVAEGKWKSLDGVIVHETTQWRTDEHVVRDEIPCTSIARTALDLSAVVSRHRRDDTIDALLRDRRLERRSAQLVEPHGEPPAGRRRTVLAPRPPFVPA